MWRALDGIIVVLEKRGFWVQCQSDKEGPEHLVLMWLMQHRHCQWKKQWIRDEMLKRRASNEGNNEVFRIQEDDVCRVKEEAGSFVPSPLEGHHHLDIPCGQGGQPPTASTPNTTSEIASRGAKSHSVLLRTAANDC